MKHELHEVHKCVDGKWKVQYPKGRMTFTTKKAAVNYANKAKELNLR